MEITIKKLTPELIDSYYYFFDHVAFTDNPHWASCYCFYYCHDHSEQNWADRTGEDNRAASRTWIESGRLNGYLAFADGKPVAWCHANDRANLQLSFSPQPEGAGQTGAIICYIVAPDFRKQGIATRLLQAACVGFEQAGFSRVEAYPRKEAEGTVQQHYHGPLGMYEKQGFAVVGEVDGGMLVVAKELG